MAKDIDISASRRIGVLCGLMAEMAGVTDARAAVEMFGRGMGRAYDHVRAVHLSTAGLAAGQYRVMRVTPGRGELLEPAAAAMPMPGYGELRSLPVHSGGIFSELTAAGRPRLLHDVDLSNDPVFGPALRGCRSLAFAPVLDPAAPVDWVALLHEAPDHFRVGDLEDLIVHANLVFAVTKGLWIGQQLEAANRQIAREIEQIARIQRTLLPSELPQIPGLAVAAYYETFDRAGGDLYDFAKMEGDPTTTDDDRWAILIADASGHGPAAATVCAIVHALFHAYPQEPGRPGELLAHVNAHLCAKQIESSFVTAFMGFYQSSTRELSCARAGHNPPLVLTSGDGAGGVRRVRRVLDKANGLPLGIDAGAPFDEERVTIAPGELVVMYTDGITEARDRAGTEFGMAGIEAALAHCTGGADAAVAALAAALRSHQAGRSTNDDQTILVLECVG